jgi:hypothetical protein
MVKKKIITKSLFQNYYKKSFLFQIGHWAGAREPPVRSELGVRSGD